MAVEKSKIPDHWGKRNGANKGSKIARKRIINTLDQDRSPLVQNDDVKYEVYLQGSYKNYTNTRGSSDVDVLVKLTTSFGRDLSNLTADQKRRYREDMSEPSYAYDDGFQDAVYEALKLQYRESAFRNPVSYSDKAIDISGSDNPLPVPVDVVPCQEYRVYHSYPVNGDPEYSEGMRFKPRDGYDWWINFPRVHYENSRDKHSNFPETVRMFKDARDDYNDRYIFSLNAPSYYIECLVYNVPDEVLKTTDLTERFDNVLSWLEDDYVDLDAFQQASEMEVLFGDENTQWNTDDAKKFIEKMRALFEKL